jgi:hypothetical protein
MRDWGRQKNNGKREPPSPLAPQPEDLKSGVVNHLFKHVLTRKLTRGILSHPFPLFVILIMKVTFSKQSGSLEGMSD